MVEDVELHLLDRLTDIAVDNPRYRREAYLFVFNAINWAGGQMEQQRHLSGQEFTHILINLARDQFGEMAYQVLQEWGIYGTRDFGEIVYTLIDAGLMSRRDDDSIQDFEDVLDIETALLDPEYEPGITF